MVVAFRHRCLHELHSVEVAAVGIKHHLHKQWKRKIVKCKFRQSVMQMQQEAVKWKPGNRFSWHAWGKNEQTRRQIQQNSRESGRTSAICARWPHDRASLAVVTLLCPDTIQKLCGNLSTKKSQNQKFFSAQSADTSFPQACTCVYETSRLGKTSCSTCNAQEFQSVFPHRIHKSYFPTVRCYQKFHPITSDF